MWSLKIICSLAMMASIAAWADTPAATDQKLFEYREVMIPMRDGISLQTAIFTPIAATTPLPILLTRTPYGVPDKAPAKMPVELKELAADGYIFVFQNLRGRFKSEGVFSLSDDVRVDPGQGTIESRDAWDSIEWLIKNQPGNNGKVGITGISYAGMTAGVTLLDPHPALKAVSEQAAPVDQWMNDDDHRYGALRLSYDFEYSVFEEADKNANTHFAFDRWDSYAWYLAAGPLSNLNDLYLHGKIRYWNETVAHPDYDDFWKRQAWITALHRAPVPTLNVAGFWDQEDPWGPWQIFRHEIENDPGHHTLMVAGPWRHGGWHRDPGSALGPIKLGHETSREFREQIEAPFFAYWLHGKGVEPDWQATMFQTGSNRWRSYPAWPPAAAKPTRLYLHADGSLSLLPPDRREKAAHRDYVSDPANPVPYRPRPISPTYPGGDWKYWEWGDQRFVDNRPDVLSFTSAPLDHDLTVSGEVSARLFASTSGSDSDFIVKLIDVFPENAEKPSWSEEDGPAPGAYADSPNGYQLPIAMEVRRGRYLASFEQATALTPHKPTLWDFPLRDRDHVFLAGHRIMLQIQSSWLPLIDRNPQSFTPSIYTATAKDFIKATQKVYMSPELPSYLILPVVAE